MDVSYSYQDSLHLLNHSEWNKLSIQNKASIMQSIENEVARRHGRPPCNVSLYSEAADNQGRISCGAYNSQRDSIEMNTYHLAEKSSDRCLNTILHEGRHAYQNSAVKGNIDHHPPSELKSWQNNMKPGNYISPEQNIKGYYRQPIEADAREYAAITTRQIQAEQKIQRYSNKGIQSFYDKSSSGQPNQPSETNKGIQNFLDKKSSADSGSGTINDMGQASGSGQNM